MLFRKRVDPCKVLDIEYAKILSLQSVNASIHLNYYFSYDVSACFRLSVCLSFCKNFFSSKMDQIRKFGEQTSRILEFKPKGLEG